MKNKSAFTLIELLVVIAIIGLLSTVVMVSVGSANNKSKDAKRITDLTEVKKAFDMQYADKGSLGFKYNCENAGGGWDDSIIDTDADGIFFVDKLIDLGIMKKTPVDPVNKGNYKYMCYVYSAGAYKCDASQGNFYIIGAVDMETSGRPYPQSPGWSCNVDTRSNPLSNVCASGGVYNTDCRNWQKEMDWVTGGYVK